MNNFKRAFFILAAMLLAAVSLPSSAAPAKIFGLVVSPSTAPSTSVSGTATYSNLTPNGNSVINTVILSPPPGSTGIGATFPNGGNRVTCPTTAPTGSICVANIPSVMKAGCSPVACFWTMNVTATLPNSCGDNTWAGQAFTGNAFSGDVFAFQSGSSSVKTTINSGCTFQITATPIPAAGGSVNCNPNPVPYNNSSTCTAMANSGYTFANFSGDCSGSTCSLSNVTSPKSVTANFVQNTLTIAAPAGAASGFVFDVTVALNNGPGGASITLASPDCTLVVTSSNPVAATGYSAAFTAKFTDAVTGPKVCTLNATADAGYAAAPSVSVNLYHGEVGCTNADNYDSINGNAIFTYDPDAAKIDFTKADGTAFTDGWGLRRGYNTNDPNNTSCTKVDVTVKPDFTHNSVTFTYDKSSGQLVSFEVLVLWDPVSVDNDLWAGKQPLVTWYTDPVQGPLYVPAPVCKFDDKDAGTAVMPTLPSTAPYNTYPPGHPYATGSQAKICVAQQGWTLLDNGTIQYWTIFIDQADSGYKIQ